MTNTGTTVSRVRIEHTDEPLGIDAARPRLSWQVKTETPNWRQRAYEIECADDRNASVSCTGRVESDESVLVDWPFEPLRSRQSVTVRVRVWGSDEPCEWSEPVAVEVGLLAATDWEARFVTPDRDADASGPSPAPCLRCEFELAAPIRRARLYVTALGVYEVRMNGRIVGDHVLAPGWTPYRERLCYQTFDVTEGLRPGANAIGAILGDGWFRGRIGFGGGRSNIWGSERALLAQLEVEYEDGTTDRILTDGAWRTAGGPILTNSIYDGETYDARLEMPGWDRSGFDDSSWDTVRAIEWNLEALCAPTGPPIRRIEELQPVSIFESPSGRTLVDFGQNLVGWLAICVRGGAGETITLRHAEVLENGELGTRPLRAAEATDRYTLRGDGEETWEPRFTFHGFRYAEVSGWPGELRPQDIRAIVVHSDMERTGWFECSNPLVNRFHENTVWGMRGNFVGVPTDCPQRDERLGWTGDLEVFAPSASFLYDCNGFLQSWLVDLAIEQRKLGGAVPHVVPDALGHGGGAAAWADAATIVPWVLHDRFADEGVLARQFESMRSWVDHVASLTGDRYLWDMGFQFGDWLDPTAPPDQPWKARTDRAIVATAYFAHSAVLVARAAGKLGREQERARYAALAERVKGAFAREYVTPAGRMMGDAETAYALAIVFELLPTPEQVSRAGDRLAELVRDGGYHIRTGFVGTPVICDALSATGHTRDAYRLLMQHECPSWLYPVTMGATTVWERWDSMLPDGSINPGEMTSFNHYALGAVVDWMHRKIGGLASAEPGYRRIRVEPRPGGGITHAKTRHLTPYGLAESSWRIEDGTFHLDVTVPPNTGATVVLPGDESTGVEVGSGEWHWSRKYFDPDARGPYTVDDLVGEIFGDPAARDTVLGLLDELGAPGFLKAVLMNERSAPLAQAMPMLADPEQAAERINGALADLAAREGSE